MTAWAGTHREDGKAEQRAFIPTLINAKAQRCTPLLSAGSRRIEALRLRVANESRNVSNCTEIRFQAVHFIRRHAIDNVMEIRSSERDRSRNGSSNI